MEYIIADIHGCYEEYLKLLAAINFSDNDVLYILGDVVDRGPEPVKVLKDIMKRHNVKLIMGNHDFIMYTIMKKIVVELGDSNYERYLTADWNLTINLWFQSGGKITMEQLNELSKEEKMDIIEYLSETAVYEIIEHNSKKYILVHAGLGGFHPDKSMEDYELYELMEERTEYSKRYYPDENVYIVTGHTPTFYINGWGKPAVYMENGHIAMDCGCVYGGKLAAFCIDTGEVTYVDGR